MNGWAFAGIVAVLALGGFYYAATSGAVAPVSPTATPVTALPRPAVSPRKTRDEMRKEVIEEMAKPGGTKDATLALATVAARNEETLRTGSAINQETVSNIVRAGGTLQTVQAAIQLTPVRSRVLTNI